MVQIGIPILYYLGVATYKFDSKKLIFYKPKRKLKRVYLNVFLILTWFAYHTFQVIRFYVAKDFNSFNFTFTCLMTFCISNISFAITLYYEDEAFPMASSMFIFLRQINSDFLPTYNPNKSTYNKIVDLLSMAFILMISLLIFVTWLCFIFLPMFPNLPGNVVPQHWPFLLRFTIVYFAPNYIVMGQYLNAIAPALAIWIYGALVVPFVVRELRLGRKSYSSCAILRRPKTLMKLYRTCQLLQQMINLLLGKFIVPIQSVITFMSVVGFFLVITRRHEFDMAPFIVLISWAGIASIGWSLVLLMGGYLHSNGNKVLNSWKYNSWNSSAERKLMNKFRVSCRPIMICYGKMYVMRKQSVLIYNRGLSRGVVRALLTMNRSEQIAFHHQSIFSTINTNILIKLCKAFSAHNFNSFKMMKYILVVLAIIAVASAQLHYSGLNGANLHPGIAASSYNGINRFGSTGGLAYGVHSCNFALPW
ncbi:unnamed protein product [Orchesella dallaii]|uniref:Gustatory receptor n=1 Tax=Orchesella dallaii TaxID=48710 RepID=A0ABP1RC92_9HEXA